MARIEKINNEVKREIGRIILRDLSDPRLEFVTITSADVSRDLRNAKIGYSVLGEADQVQAARAGLEGAKGMIRRQLGKTMNMRHTPELNFIYDDSIEMSARIEGALKEIRDENEEHHSDDQEK